MYTDKIHVQGDATYKHFVDQDAQRPPVHTA